VGRVTCVWQEETDQEEDKTAPAGKITASLLLRDRGPVYCNEVFNGRGRDWRLVNEGRM